MSKEIKNWKEYRDEIPLYDKDPKFDRTQFRLETAIDVRKFEIDLYWKRAAYFWTFIAAAFAGYGLTISTEHPTLELYKFQFVITCLGFILSYGWYLANKGSKFWQENWETHLNILEEDVIGALHKTIVYRKTFFDFLIPTKSYAVSVSKINQILSFFITLVWLSLILNFFISGYITVLFCLKYLDPFYNIIGVLTFLIFLYITFGTKTEIKNTKIHMESSELENYEDPKANI